MLFRSQLIRAAEHNEKEEADDVYQEFARVAKEEGFLEAASAFSLIAEVERTHQLRFAQVAEMLEKNEYFASENTGKWICTNCGYIFEGKQGTGKTAQTEDIIEAHAIIRELLKDIIGTSVSQTRILYGGSVKPENAREILELDNVEGLLVGGASLKAESFAKIIQA